MGMLMCLFTNSLLFNMKLNLKKNFSHGCLSHEELLYSGFNSFLIRANKAKTVKKWIFSRKKNAQSIVSCHVGFYTLFAQTVVHASKLTCPSVRIILNRNINRNIIKHDLFKVLLKLFF